MSSVCENFSWNLILNFKKKKKALQDLEHFSSYLSVKMPISLLIDKKNPYVINILFCRTCFSMVRYRRPVFRPSVFLSTIYVDPSI